MLAPDSTVPEQEAIPEPWSSVHEYWEVRISPWTTANPSVGELIVTTGGARSGAGAKGWMTNRSRTAPSLAEK